MTWDTGQEQRTVDADTDTDTDRDSDTDRETDTDTDRDTDMDMVRTWTWTRACTTIPIRKYIFRIFHDEQRMIDNQIIKYKRLSLVINNIVTFKPWIGDNFIEFYLKFQKNLDLRVR